GPGARGRRRGRDRRRGCRGRRGGRGDGSGTSGSPDGDRGRIPGRGARGQRRPRHVPVSPVWLWPLVPRPTIDHAPRDPAMTLRQRRALTVAVGLVVVGALAWSLRWVVGGRAIEIVDPVVRRWAAAEVARLSDGSYRLEVSPLRVDAAEQ